MDYITLILATPILLYPLAGLLVIAIAIFAVAVVQGREVSFWPPKIGAKSPKAIPPKVENSPAIGNSLSYVERSSAVSGVSDHSITGTWLCQYKYPQLDEMSGCKAMTTETQLVRLEQQGSLVTGATIFALAHPESFEGKITKERYFTGLYFNQQNHHSYHGAFQFVISNSKHRMLGRWVGFNREGNGVDSEEWRWERIDENPNICEMNKSEHIAKARDQDLFAVVSFL